MALHEWVCRFNVQLRELGIAADGVDFVLSPGHLFFYARGANGRTFFSFSEAPGGGRELGWARWGNELIDIPIDPDNLDSADPIAAEVAAALHAGDYNDLDSLPWLPPTTNPLP